MYCGAVRCGLQHTLVAADDRQKGLGLLLCLLQASGLTGMFEKLAEFFRRNQLQKSDQR
jgi:hypothetical protein